MGSGMDLCRHVAGFTDYQRSSGFVSVASDVRTALDMFISWKITKKDLLGAWNLDAAIAKYAKEYARIKEQINQGAGTSPVPRVVEKLRLASLYSEELHSLRVIKVLQEDRESAAWVEGWMYVIKSTPYYISVEKNLQSPARARLAGPRAVTLSKHATEWDAIFYIKPQSIREAVKVRFTRLKQGVAGKAALVHDVLIESRKNPAYDAGVVFDPYTDPGANGQFKGLIGYWAPALETPGSPGYPYLPGAALFPSLDPSVWSGKREYARPDGPRYPFGRPEDMQPSYPAWQAKGALA
ncbi:hypothetical protein [Embleya sp. NPDC020886]|uniref:hypothetical protein n=1 Tax=Embleya sp. NPDC020886 TaxID=3363980 RepID=UPI0037ACAD78